MAGKLLIFPDFSHASNDWGDKINSLSTGARWTIPDTTKVIAKSRRLNAAQVAFPLMSARLPQHLIRPRTWPSLLLALAFFASACGNAESGEDNELPLKDSSPTSELSAQVPGGGIGVFDGNWVLTDADVFGQPEVNGRPLKELIILFEVDDSTSTLVVHTNCHERSGSYTFSSDQSASISLPGSTTQTCDDTAAAFEDLAVQLLESVTGWERSDDKLTLFADPNPDDKTSVVSSPPENPFPATLVFHPVD